MTAPLKPQIRGSLRRIPGEGKRGLIYGGYDPENGKWSGDFPTPRLLQAVRVGNRMEAAAEWAGIGASTLYEWLRRGRNNEPSADADREEVPDEHRPYVDLFRELVQAEAHAEVNLVTDWRAQAKNDWRGAMNLLARRFPKAWRGETHVEVSGLDGGPIAVAALGDPDIARAVASDPVARQLAGQLLARIAPAAPPRAGEDDELPPLSAADLEGDAFEAAADPWPIDASGAPADEDEPQPLGPDDEEP